MSVRCGLVGLPNVGKSTIFCCLTKLLVAAENYPFCTIDPNISSVAVPDERLFVLARIAHSANVIPSFCEFVDIAGLVSGASQGEGLGNQFLSHIRETDALIHVVRCFSDENVIHVQGVVDPISDIRVIQTELVLSDLATLERYQAKQTKLMKASSSKDVRESCALLAYVIDKLNQDACLIRSLDLSEEQKVLLKPLQLLTDKPYLYCANVDEADLSQNVHFSRLVEWAEKEKAPVLALNASAEKELLSFSDEERHAFLQDMGFEDSGLGRLIRAAYALLGLHSYFTVGPKECRAWTIPLGTKAQQAAGVIHSDMERGFIRAEIVSYENYVSYQGLSSAREAGKVRSEGRDYIINDGDVIHFRFNV